MNEAIKAWLVSSDHKPYCSGRSGSLGKCNCGLEAAKAEVRDKR